MEELEENEEVDVIVRPDDTKTMHNYYKKYLALKKRCDSIHLVNERLVNRIYYIKKMIRKLSRERRALIATLDEHGDDCRNAPLMIVVEDDMPFTAVSSSDLGGDFSDVPSSVPPIKQSVSPSVSVASPSNIVTTSKPVASAPRKKKRRDDKPEKEKDPNAPKKPANAYLMFCQQARAPVQEEHQNLDKDDISHQELTKELAKRWNELTTDQKQAYYDMYQKDKLRYERELQEYNASLQNASAANAPSSTITQSMMKLDANPVKVERIMPVATVALTLPTISLPKVKQDIKMKVDTKLKPETKLKPDKVLESAYSRNKMERQELAKETTKPQPPPLPDDYDPYDFDDEESKRS
ncbi:uncharacterized protein [Antedon mediterranea]|uniref:uncharacterized protein n=1 Tax=Antedon mediterranea TaxID=105859 RepID=UPI003AF5A6F4